MSNEPIEMTSYSKDFQQFCLFEKRELVIGFIIIAVVTLAGYLVMETMLFIRPFAGVFEPLTFIFYLLGVVFAIYPPIFTAFILIAYVVITIGTYLSDHIYYWARRLAYAIT